MANYGQGHHSTLKNVTNPRTQNIHKTHTRKKISNALSDRLDPRSPWLQDPHTVGTGSHDP